MALIDEVKVRQLRALFEPRRIAVIGASRRPSAVGYAILNNLQTAGFQGEIYPVNPKSDGGTGLHYYASLNDIDQQIDLAVIIVPSQTVPDTLAQCGQKGVGAAIVISAGFREIGEEGFRIEEHLKQVARTYDIPVLGPNCLGLINTDPRISINASFSRTMPRAGNIAFLSQSGALCAAILDYAKGKNIGFSKFISMGNKTDLNELDMLRYLKADPETDVILMYLEDLVDGRGFIELAREISGEMKPPKPILAIKSGRTPQGAKAASSHTGSLMGSDEVYDAIFAQAGVLRVNSIEDMFLFAEGFAKQPLPKSNRVAIVTNAGGPGIMATDACVRYGLEMAHLSDSTTEILKSALPPTANISNPVDVIGDAQHDRYEKALDAVVKDPNVDSLIVILTPQAMTDIEDIAKSVVTLDQSTEKTVLACFMGIVDVSVGTHILEENEVPYYTFPEQAARTLAAMMRYKQWTERPRTDVREFSVDVAAAASLIADAQTAGSKFLTIDQSMKILETYHFPVLAHRMARSKEEAVAHARDVRFPVAMKLISPQLIHKFDLGGVSLNLQNEHEVEKAYDTMVGSLLSHLPGAHIQGAIIQAMAQKGQEVILGMKRDPHFGPILMFGLGGIYVEALKDVTFRLAPIREFGAQRMVQSVRTYALLKGVRGQKPSDINAIKESLERLSQLVCNHPEIEEIDINPLIVYPEGKGAAVADARIILSVS